MLTGIAVELVQQIATFIITFFWSDVEIRNMPPIKHTRQIALIDLEERAGRDVGFLGSPSRTGLIRCLSSEHQIDCAILIAKQFGLTDETCEAVKLRRLEEIASYHRLQAFYAENGLLDNPRKPIDVADLETLGLNLDDAEEMVMYTKDGRTKTTTTLREAVTHVISRINHYLTLSPEEASVKGQRSICLPVNCREEPLLNAYNDAGLPKEVRVPTPEQQKELWLRKIIDALVAKGHIFELCKVDGYGWHIQA